MRLLFLTPMPHLVTFGGANRSIRLTAERLAAAGHEVMVAGSLLGEGPGNLTLAELAGRAPLSERCARAEVSTKILGVTYLGLHPLKESLAALAAAAERFAPELLLVAGEDTDGCLYEIALNYDASRTAVFAQTPDLLSLYPGGDPKLQARREMLASAGALVVTSQYARTAAAAAGLDHAQCVFPPVFEVPDTPGRGDAGVEADRAGRPRRRYLHHPLPGQAGRGVHKQAEARLLHIEPLGTVCIGDRDEHQLERVVHRHDLLHPVKRRSARKLIGAAVNPTGPPRG